MKALNTEKIGKQRKWPEVLYPILTRGQNVYNILVISKLLTNLRSRHLINMVNYDT